MKTSMFLLESFNLFHGWFLTYNWFLLVYAAENEKENPMPYSYSYMCSCIAHNILNPLIHL